MSFSNISFILHKPQLSENIGACARAIKNFNFNKLIIVNPKPLFPNDQILATSVGAKEIIKGSKVYNKLEHAIKKVDFVIATSSRSRNKNIKHIKLNDFDFKKKLVFYLVQKLQVYLIMKLVMLTVQCKFHQILSLNL